MSDDQKDVAEQEQWWYFTFGYNQDPGIGYYARFFGTYHSARKKMIERFGTKWAFQYTSAETAGIKKYNLKDVDK